nr:VWA domain-containing protein [Virgisporangium aliadipatigenens]
MLPWCAGPASAREPEPTEAPKVELVLDVSGSMKAADLDGRTRISVAQQAFNDVVDALPEQTELGIRVLGATYSGSDKATGCKDTQQLLPVGRVDRGRAKDAIAGLKPTGFTPVGLALRGAAQDLGTGNTTRRIVLITDGEDTCAPPDPCQVARELAAQGTHLVVDTLGLSPDDKVRQQLTCIANATGGSYFAARNGAQLTERIKQLVKRAGDTYTKAPTQVAGTDRCETAPTLSQGVYNDREKFSEHRYYKVPVPAGQELRASVSVTLDRPVRKDFGVLVRATTADGRELVRGTDAGSGRTDVLSAGVRWSTESDDDKPTSVCLVVSNSLAPQAGVDEATGMPVELVVGTADLSPTPASPGLGRGLLFILLLTLVGFGTGLVAGWLFRWRLSLRRVA